MATTARTDAPSWDLSDLYAGADDPAIERDVEQGLAAARTFRERYAGKVGTLAAAELAEATAEYERIRAGARRFAVYAQLRFDSDTTDEEAGRLLGRAQEFQTALETELLFFELEWAAADDGHADAVLADPKLDRYAFVLRSRRRFKPHLLSEPEERVLAEKSLTGASAWERLYTDLLASIRVELDGADVSIDEARERLRTLTSREERRAVAEAIGAGLEPGLRHRAFVLNTVAAERAVEDRLRGFPTWLSYRNLENQISDEAADALIDAVVDRFEIARRHFRLRARLLGLPKLAHYDRFAPIEEEVAHVSFAEAEELLRETYGGFSPRAGEIVGNFFDGRWIDAAPRLGKGSGAYCVMRVPGGHPYILMSYAGSRLSLLTLAHELGHGLHGVLEQEQSYLNTDIPLTFVEIGSVFGEALTVQRLLERAEDPRDRLALLVELIDGAIGTVFGTVNWNRIEHAVHVERAREGELSAARINELCREAYERFHGDAVDSAGTESHWSMVPHFVAVPGYMYAYAFGYLAAQALFARYGEEREAFVEPFLDLLRAGGSSSPQELLAGVGFDIGDPGFWHAGLDRIEAHVAEAERLADEL
jgi:oligoendopeptidase F